MSILRCSICGGFALDCDCHLGEPTAQPSERGELIAHGDARHIAVGAGRHVSAQETDDDVALPDPEGWRD